VLETHPDLSCKSAAQYTRHTEPQGGVSGLRSGVRHILSAPLTAWSPLEPSNQSFLSNTPCIYESQVVAMDRWGRQSKPSQTLPPPHHLVVSTRSPVPKDAQLPVNNSDLQCSPLVLLQRAHTWIHHHRVAPITCVRVCVLSNSTLTTHPHTHTQAESLQTICYGLAISVPKKAHVWKTWSLVVDPIIER
jgi:hypothetical protein